jgi:hypothetical protein
VGDGNTALVGAEQDNSMRGAAWMFTRSGSSWSQQGTKLTGIGETGEGDFGDAVALSSDASTALIGARGDNEFIGAGFVFAPPVPPFVAHPIASPPGPRPPTVGALSQSHRVWREGSQLASFSRAHHRPPVGTTFSFTLDEPASLTFAFTRDLPGRRSHGHCVGQTRHNRRAKACTRRLAAGALAFSGHAGHDSLRFAGRLSRSRKLSPGRYELQISAVNAAGQKTVATPLAFVVVG